MLQRGRRTTYTEKRPNWKVSAQLCNSFRLAESLLEHESINLPHIIKILGERPFPMKESLKDYLREIEHRDQQAEQVKYDANAAEEENAAT